MVNFAGHTGRINSVAFSLDSKTAISVSDDNTSKLWDLSKGELIYTTVVNEDGSQWLVYDNEGYWDASPNGGDLVSMVKGFKVWNIDQFAVRNNRPDKIMTWFAGAGRLSFPPARAANSAMKARLWATVFSQKR